MSKSVIKPVLKKKLTPEEILIQKKQQNKKKQLEKRKREEQETIILNNDNVNSLKPKLKSLIQIEEEAQIRKKEKQEIINEEQKEIPELLKKIGSGKLNLWDVGYEVKYGFQKPKKVSQKMIKEAIRRYFGKEDGEDAVQTYVDFKKEKREAMKTKIPIKYSIRMVPILDKNLQKEKDSEKLKARNEKRINKTLTKLKSKVSNTSNDTTN